MNVKMIRYILGRMLGVEALLLLIPAIVGAIYQEESAIYFIITAAILGIVFLFVGRKKPENSRIYGKDGMIVVSLAWILWSLFGAMPFTLSGSIPSYIDAFFETVSGFTTTGSTILTDVEALPNCMLFWRSFTHWIGGMGVLVFVLMLTNLDKNSAMYLMKAEVPGPEKDKLVPKMKSTARILYAMYFGMTVLLAVLLHFGGMNVFDSLIHAFSTAGTGGFSNYNASVGHFDSAYIDAVFTIFMVLFGVNFNLYYLVLIGEFKPILKNEELKAYFLIIAAASGLITLNICGQYDSILQSFRYAAFQVGTIITTTGFATADYVTWPLFSQCILIMLMIIGACASSTGGGIKVSRFLIVLKSIKREIKQMVHPKSVSIIRINGKKIGADTLRGVYIYLLSYIAIMVGSILLVALDNFDFGSTVTAVITTLNNIGPGIGMVGPTGNFSEFSVFSKLVFCFDMLAGRLEIFPFLMLFSSIKWKKDF